MSTPLDRAERRLARGDLTGALQSLPAGSREPAVHHLRGVVLWKAGRAEEAVAAMARATALAPAEPAWAEAHAEALLRAQRWEEAEAAAAAIVARHPGRASAHDLCGRCALERADLAAALLAFAAALERRPGHAPTLTNLAVALNRAGQWPEAARCAEAALRLDPRLVPARINLGQSLRAQRRWDEALAALAPVSRDPRARFNRGFVHLHRGEFEAGWPLAEARLELPAAVRGPGSPWAGESVAGTLAVVAEQGLGDLLFMSGFLPQLAARAGQVVVECAEPLLRLLERSFPTLRFVPSLAGIEADAWVPAMSLPHRLGVTHHAQFPAAPWLSPAHRGSRGGRPRVGINWAGNPRYAYDAIRSAALAQWAPLLAEPDVEWVSLHRGAREHEAAAAGLAQPLASARDFLDTAEVIADLDLVLSTETAVPNLACAMGVPTVVLTSPDPDWRWVHAYRGVTVAAQVRVGDWDVPIAIARDAVRALTAARAAA
jgi:tetratricopeptide (TPR) repeat protein